MYAYSVENIK